MHKVIQFFSISVIQKANFHVFMKESALANAFHKNICFMFLRNDFNA